MFTMNGFWGTEHNFDFLLRIYGKGDIVETCTLILDIFVVACDSVLSTQLTSFQQDVQTSRALSVYLKYSVHLTQEVTKYTRPSSVIHMYDSALHVP